ncbi:MAG: FapA family protein, partial [Treponema sp.]|nr:FapA family protein [Treponema sp.]
MIDFAQLQETAKKNLERDRSIRSIKASGPTLEYAVSDAATTLDIPVYRVEYEVLERGFPGFMGMGKKDWQIQAYERISKIKKKIDVEEEVFEEVEAVPQIKNKDGRAFVFMQAGGKVMLKVTPPEGHGARAARHDIEPIFHRKGAGNIDWKKVEKALHVASGEYVQVGEFDHHSYNDSVVTVRIADGDMQAFMTVSAPGEGGCDIPYDDYVLTLKMNKVVHGIKEDFLLEFADWPIYREEVEVAVGSKPVDGKPAWMQYEFETDQNKVRLKEGTSGKINFKELNIIHNVVENQLLATKIPPQSGTPGETVTGRTLPAGDGRDISMPVGENVVEGPDGATLYSKISGRVVFTNGKVNVEPVLVVEGNVSLQTGNILFLGTVVIRGDVEDGFSVKAAGDVEVHGSIARAEIDAEGNIMVHQGINGKGEG